MTCRDLVCKLGRNPPSSANELFDIATNFAFGEEAVGAIFDGEKSKREGEAPAEDTKPKNNPKKPRRGKKGKKKGRLTNAVKGRRKTPMRLSSLPLIAKEAEAPLEAAAYSTTCSISHTANMTALRSNPSDRSTCPSALARRTTSARRYSPSR